MYLFSFGHVVTLFEIFFICIPLCSFGHAVTILGVLLYMHELIFIFRCCGCFGNLALYECAYTVWSGCDSVMLALMSFGPAVTLLGILFICMQLCLFVNNVALLRIRFSMHALMFV